MQVIHTLTDWFNIQQAIPTRSKSLGFVPTMGALHAGHLSLLERAKAENDLTLLSIFVNPTQFNDPKDYANYPHQLEEDLALTASLGIDYILLPTVDMLYQDHHHISLTTQHPMALILEGQRRPGHFNGVLTVVLKLLLIAQATRAYFGDKDYQQCLLVEELVKSYFIKTTIVRCSTIRSQSGLPPSSRYLRLSPQERVKLDSLYQTIYPNDLNDPQKIAAEIKKQGFSLDYLEYHGPHWFLAFRVGSVRVIDHF